MHLTLNDQGNFDGTRRCYRGQIQALEEAFPTCYGFRRCAVLLQSNFMPLQ